ncbi:cytochrome P450 [Paraburkholderia jirisanensis]
MPSRSPSPSPSVNSSQSQMQPDVPTGQPSLATPPSPAPSFRQPLLELPASRLSSLEFVRVLRHNGLQLWPREAYEADFIEQHLFGRKRFLLNKPDMIHRVLVENHHNYGRTDASIRLLRPLAGNGLLLSSGDDWKHQRRTIAPTLAPKMLPVLTRHVAACVDEEVDALSQHGGAPLDLLAAMQALALKIAARSMFSLEMREYGQAVRGAMQDFKLHHTRLGIGDLVLPIGIPTPRDIGRAGFRKRWLALLDDIIEVRARQPDEGGPRDLFDALRAARDPETGAGFSRAELRDQIGTMIVAGHETTALLLFWALYVLASAPAEQAAVAAEVRNVDLSPAHAGQISDSLPYTRAVVHETLRLYPPVWLMARKCLAADHVDGLNLPRGTQLLISPWVLHHHRGLWDQPDLFDPARFLPGAPAPARFTWLPFGSGPRVCVGAQFALAEATIVLARLVQAFEIECTESKPVHPRALATTTPERAALFSFKPRRA